MRATSSRKELGLARRSRPSGRAYFGRERGVGREEGGRRRGKVREETKGEKKVDIERKEKKKRTKGKSFLSHLSSTCGGRLCSPESALRRPEGAGRPAIGRKAETGGESSKKEEDEEKTEEADGAQGNRSGGAGVGDLTTTETRPALAARRRKAAPERMAPFLVFPFRGNRGGGGGAGAGEEAAASAAGDGGDIFFFSSFGQKGGQRKRKMILSTFFRQRNKQSGALYNSLSRPLDLSLSTSRPLSLDLLTSLSRPLDLSLSTSRPPSPSPLKRHV